MTYAVGEAITPFNPIPVKIITGAGAYRLGEPVSDTNPKPIQLVDGAAPTAMPALAVDPLYAGYPNVTVGMDRAPVWADETVGTLRNFVRLNHSGSTFTGALALFQGAKNPEGYLSLSRSDGTAITMTDGSRLIYPSWLAHPAEDAVPYEQTFQVLAAATSIVWGSGSLVPIADLQVDANRRIIVAGLFTGTEANSRVLRDRQGAALATTLGELIHLAGFLRYSPDVSMP